MTDTEKVQDMMDKLKRAVGYLSEDLEKGDVNAAVVQAFWVNQLGIELDNMTRAK